MFIDINGKEITENEYMNILESLARRTGFNNIEMFPGDWNRYKQAIEILDKVDLLLDYSSKILDLGSPLPFITLYTAMKYGSKIYCYDVGIEKEWNIDSISGKHFNVCRDSLGVHQWDFISFTEVIEHLPCNMNLAREKVISGLRDGKHLFMSFPLGARNAKEYGRDLINEFWDVTHTHLREFTEESAMDFINNLKIVSTAKIVPPSYRWGSIQILYKKEFIK